MGLLRYNCNRGLCGKELPLVILMEDGSLLVDEIQTEEDDENSPQKVLLDEKSGTTCSSN